MERIQRKQKLFEDNKDIYERIKKTEAEMREEIGHYYQGVMYAMFIAAMKKAKLSDRTVNRVQNYIAGTLNSLDSGEITISDVKDMIESEYGYKVIFDVNRHIVGINMFEEGDNGK